MRAAWKPAWFDGGQFGQATDHSRAPEATPSAQPMHDASGVIRQEVCPGSAGVPKRAWADDETGGMPGADLPSVPSADCEIAPGVRWWIAPGMTPLEANHLEQILFDPWPAESHAKLIGLGCVMNSLPDRPHQVVRQKKPKVIHEPEQTTGGNGLQGTAPVPRLDKSGRPGRSGRTSGFTTVIVCARGGGRSTSAWADD